jgi:hypothetical protein
MIVKNEFNVGEYNITVLDANVKNFRLGTIAKFDISLLTKWNKPIDNVHGSITIKDKNGTTVGQTNITDITINPNINSVTAYLDTANMISGEYIVGIKLFAGNKIITQEYPSIISSDKIEIGTRTENKTVDKKYNFVAALLILTAGVLIVLLFKQNKKLYK